MYELRRGVPEITITAGNTGSLVIMSTRRCYLRFRNYFGKRRSRLIIVIVVAPRTLNKIARRLAAQL